MNACKQDKIVIAPQRAQATQTPHPKMPKITKAYVKHCYNSLVAKVENRISRYTSLTFRRAVRREQGRQLYVASLGLSQRYFEPKVNMSVKARCHLLSSNECECQKCFVEGPIDVDDARCSIELFFVVNTVYPNKNNDVFRHFEIFELTNKIHKVVKILKNPEFIKSVMRYFKTYYPFARCISCLYKYAEAGNLCHNCDANAVQYNTNGERCSICLDTEVRLVCVKLDCGHIFHEVCYLKHMYASNGIEHTDENTQDTYGFLKTKCPLCKSENDSHDIY